MWRIFSTWQSVMWRISPLDNLLYGQISPHDNFFLHGHRPWCPWQIWGMDDGYISVKFGFKVLLCVKELTFHNSFLYASIGGEALWLSLGTLQFWNLVEFSEKNPNNLWRPPRIRFGKLCWFFFFGKSKNSATKFIVFVLKFLTKLPFMIAKNCKVFFNRSRSRRRSRCERALYKLWQPEKLKKVFCARKCLLWETDFVQNLFPLQNHSRRSWGWDIKDVKNTNTTSAHQQQLCLSNLLFF